MIISASRRTDIPACYSQWLVNRMKAGEVLVRNPMNPRQVSRVVLSPETVDGFVFWTKNPIPMMEHLHVFDAYAYYFQFTLNAYGSDVEPGIPAKGNTMIPAFCRLADRIGPERVIWRYDPILLSDTYTIEHHIRYFDMIAKRLHPYTRKCTISFIDLYSKTLRNGHGRALTIEEQYQLAEILSQIAHSYGLAMDTCAEHMDLERFGIGHARCIDGQLFEKLLGVPVSDIRDKSQRPACRCMQSIDIGAYDTCVNGCTYCYANMNAHRAMQNYRMHNPDSALLIGDIQQQDRIADRKMASCRTGQTSLWI